MVNSAENVDRTVYRMEPVCFVMWLMRVGTNHVSPFICVFVDTYTKLPSQGKKSRWGRNFSHSTRLTPVPTQPAVKWVPGLSRGYRGLDVVLTTHPLLAPTPRMSRVTPLLTHCACGASYGADCTFSFLHIPNILFVT
jgi:hypothetical protein